MSWNSSASNKPHLLLLSSVAKVDTVLFTLAQEKSRKVTFSEWLIACSDANQPSPPMGRWSSCPATRTSKQHLTTKMAECLDASFSSDDMMIELKTVWSDLGWCCVCVRVWDSLLGVCCHPCYGEVYSCCKQVSAESVDVVLTELRTEVSAMYITPPPSPTPFFFFF